MHPFPVALIVVLTVGFAGGAGAQSRYDNPVDQKTYVTSGEFKTYSPATPRGTRGQRVTTAGVRLLTGEPDLKTRITVQDLSAFIKTVEARASSELMRNKSAMDVLVQFNCQPGKCEIKLMSQGEAESSTLQAFHDALIKLPPLRASGEVVFQVEFHVGA